MAALLDPERGSVYESLFAVLMHTAHVPTPICQFVVRDRGVFIARVDFAWCARRLVVEIDGFAYHSDRIAFQADRVRQNALI